MNNLKIEISPEEFDNLKTAEEKLNVIYSALVVQQKRCKSVLQRNNTRFTKLEKRKVKDTGLAAAFGGIFGFLAGLLKGH